jgi:vacuolar-type H+-ATPase subunit H
MMQPSDIFADLNEREIDYVKARANAKSNRQALRDANLSQGWLQNRDAENLYERAMAFKADVTYRAQEILDSAVEEAARVKAGGLKARDERIKQAAATEILDRKFGKPTQRQEVTGKDGGVIVVEFGEPIPPRSDG